MTRVMLDGLHSRFLSILPRIKEHARISFRHVRCHFKKADFIAEVIALSWRWFVRLANKGKDACRFPAVLATFAVRHVSVGRRLCGQLKPKDVLSERAQRLKGFVVGKLPDFDTLKSNPLMDALVDNTRSAVPDQVSFRCDFPAWVKSRSQRDRRLIHDMAMNEKTSSLARKHKLSSARVSQLRRDFKIDWDRFTSA